ncbi:MAG: hypothetical protein ACYDDG_07450 [Casimicrobiaceae bacterium]
MNDHLVEIRAERPLIRVALNVGLFFVLLTAGCAGVMPAPPPASSPETTAAIVAPVAPTTAPPSTPAPIATRGRAAAVEAASASATPSTSVSTAQRDTKAAPPVGKAPPSVPAVPVPKKDSAPPQVAKPKAPPLDLASLETRLKETKAIGFLTKIALKNQIDDLLGQFRAFYQGKLKTSLAELRRPYELLVLKVLALLQDTDPALASALVASRDAIWGILSDPAKFATI